jgi:hypothetical protein
MLKKIIVSYILVICFNYGSSQTPILEQIGQLNDESSMLIIENRYKSLNENSPTNWIFQDKVQIGTFLLSLRCSDSTSILPSKISKQIDSEMTFIIYQGDSMVMSFIYYPKSNFVYLYSTKLYYKCESDQFESFKQMGTQVIQKYFSTTDLKLAREKYNSLRSNDSVILFHLPYGKPQWLDYDGFCWFTLLDADSIGLTMDSLQNYFNKKYPDQDFKLLINGEYENSRSIEIRTFKVLFDQIKNDPITWSVERNPSTSKHEVSFIIRYPVKEHKNIKTYDRPKTSTTRKLNREIKKLYKNKNFSLEWKSGNERNGGYIVYKIKSSEKFMHDFNIYPKGHLTWRQYNVSFSYWIVK